MRTSFRIVVGVDGSEGGRRALRWAIDEVAARGGTVQAVNAWSWVAEDRPTNRSAGAGVGDDQSEAEKLLLREIESVPNRAGISVASEAVEGRPADVLTAAARDADLLVLGSHGHSRVWHTVLGSVTEECVRFANCPVVVLPVGRLGPRAPYEPLVPASQA
jgi:nucleotide-binding universal stress UspA family protein